MHQLATLFPPIWRVHPFREGNTRTVVMMMTFFVEHHGYYMDQELLAACSGYVRDAFVMASLDQYAEYQHLEKILLDAVCSAPISYLEESLEEIPQAQENIKRSPMYQSRITSGKNDGSVHVQTTRMTRRLVVNPGCFITDWTANCKVSNTFQTLRCIDNPGSEMLRTSARHLHPYTAKTL